MSNDLKATKESAIMSPMMPTLIPRSTSMDVTRETSGIALR